MSIAAMSSLFIFVGLFALITVGLLGAMAFALMKLVKTLDTVVGKIDPVLAFFQANTAAQWRLGI